MRAFVTMGQRAANEFVLSQRWKHGLPTLLRTPESTLEPKWASQQAREEVTALHCGVELFFLTWPAFVNLENEIGVRDGVRNGALPRRAWLDTYLVLTAHWHNFS